MPDPGPRVEPNLTTAEAASLDSAKAQLRTGQFDAAISALERIEQQGTKFGVVPIARAYRAEAVYTQQVGTQFRFDAIAIYQTLIREFPDSLNASRAAWRVGDLYAEQGWQVEAQAAYERAAKDAAEPSDKARAFLGLGLMQLHSGRARQAVETLKGLRYQAIDEQTRSWVMFGLAEGYYGLQRLSEAADLYRQLQEHWPERLRGSPEALLHVAEVERRQGHEDVARGLLLTFHNLYPRHREAPPTLVQLGDSLKKAGLLTQAELIYGLTIEQYATAEEAQVARLRLAELGKELADRQPRHPLALDVADQFATGLRAPLSPEGQREILESISAAHPDKMVASEALVRLAELDLEADQSKQAQRTLQAVCQREGRVVGDDWPMRARRRLAEILRPKLVEAIREADDYHVVEVFHRFGPCPDWESEHLDLILHLAESHRRLGFAEPSIALYQQVLRMAREAEWRQHALLGLGRAYLDQRDGLAARNVFDRYLLEFPLGEMKGEALKFLSESWAHVGDAAAVEKAARRWFKWAGPRASEDPGYGSMLLRLAGAQAVLERYGDAVHTVRQAEQAGVLPYVQARLREARLWDSNGSVQAAIAQWAEVVRVEPGSCEASVARLHMARAWWLQQRWPEAALMLGKVQSDGSDDVLARAAKVLKRGIEVARQAGKDKRS
ncbi:hypothetical protein YTPLAS18_27620 [Nitrospira sp.]|nr:hypothetical protein YTPLAS18_27620 [Nitrospira sp.]